MLAKNDQIPHNIGLQDTLGGISKIEDFLGNYVALYFYPKDDTPGCTKEACDFRDFNQEIEKLGAKVIGVSKDSIKKHHNFIKKHNLNFLLLSDPESELQKAFGVWQEKKFMGKTYMGTVRSTFLIDPTGKIVHVWESVNPLGHGKDVYETLKSYIAH